MIKDPFAKTLQKEPINIERFCDLQSSLKTLCSDSNQSELGNIQYLLAFEN